mgnify:CR=1 FL=1
MISSNRDDHLRAQRDAEAAERTRKARNGRLAKLIGGFWVIVFVGLAAFGLISWLTRTPEDPEKAAVHLVTVTIQVRDDALRARDPSVLAPYLGEELLAGFTASVQQMIQEGYIIDEETTFELLGTQLTEDGKGVFVGGTEHSVGRVFDNQGVQMEEPFDETHAYAYHVEKDAAGRWRLVNVAMVG